MALTPIEKPRKVRRFLTYDLEWRKGEYLVDHLGRRFQRPQVRMAGVFDGDRYRWYRTIEGFLQGELTSENRGAWFYAHAGGLADMIFLLEILADWPSYEVQAAFSGSSAIIVHVRKGKNVWHFVDSYWLLRDKLANIAKSVGMEKGDVSFDESNLAELVEYNEDDCRILWTAIDLFEDTLLGLGGELKMTLASCAMALFRRKYLKRTIFTSDSVNQRAKKAYYASRVEVFQKRVENAFYYDVNSSFPHSMTFPVPGNLIESRARGLRDSAIRSEKETALVDATILVPDHMDLPPMALRPEEGLGIYFPVGKWRAWFCGVDLELLLRKGGKILRVHETLYFEMFDDLSDYAEDLYDKRNDAKRSGDSMQSMVYKLLLNSLYGKFAEQSEKTGLVLHPFDPPEIWEEEGRGMQSLFPGAYIQTKEVTVSHAHVIVSAHITARSRRLLYDYMDSAGTYHYCDTDGFSTHSPDVETGDELGELKLETVIKKGVFHRPKVYMIEDDKGEQKARAKGFTLRPEKDEIDRVAEEDRKDFVSSRSVDRFLALLDGKDIEMTRFVRIRELFKSGNVLPTERVIKKGFRDTTREKRQTLADGVHTRPWDAKELLAD